MAVQYLKLTVSGLTNLQQTTLATAISRNLGMTQGGVASVFYDNSGNLTVDIAGEGAAAIADDINNRISTLTGRNSLREIVALKDCKMRVAEDSKK